jgi:hypothetical protein
MFELQQPVHATIFARKPDIHEPPKPVHELAVIEPPILFSVSPTGEHPHGSLLADT